MLVAMPRLPETWMPDAEATGSVIQAQNVGKTYETSSGPFSALRGVTLTVNHGEFLAVVGKSGSGKSTLVNVLTGIDRPTSGEVRVAGAQLQKLNENQLAAWRGRSVGVVFQFFQLLPTLTILENILLPMDFCSRYRTAERQDRAMNLLGMVDLADQADRLPAQLSGGQQQRAAIARALANDPPLLIADEPTGNLDSRTANAIFALFERLVGAGKTILMVTHDNDLARRANRLIRMHDGEIVDDVTGATAGGG